VILLYAILAGILAGLVRAWFARRDLSFPELRMLWLAPAAFLPQYLAFQFTATRGLFTDTLAAFILVETQLLLLGFVWVNRRKAGFWLLGLGLLLNLMVIAFNGGFMPISQETVARLAPQASPETWIVGERLGSTKDIVLPAASIHLEWLADRYVIAAGLTGNRVAFSLGDVLIALGAFWLFWSMGSLDPGKIYQPLRTPSLSFTLGGFQWERERE
jgi:hypothetical protein